MAGTLVRQLVRRVSTFRGHAQGTTLAMGRGMSNPIHRRRHDDDTLPYELARPVDVALSDEERGLLDALSALRSDDDHCSPEVRAALDELLRD